MFEKFLQLLDQFYNSLAFEGLAYAIFIYIGQPFDNDTSNENDGLNIVGEQPEMLIKDYYKT